MLLMGALGSSFFLANASEATLAVVLSFGAAALIYLIAEELLVETIQAEESIFSTITLFTGFLDLTGDKATWAWVVEFTILVTENHNGMATRSDNLSFD